MFSSLSGFQLPSSESCYFTDVAVSLFPYADETPMRVLSSTLDETPLPVDTSVLDPSISSLNVSQELASSSNDSESSSVSATNPVLPHLSQVSQQPTYLQDYDCYSLVSIIYEPHTLKEAKNDPNWQKAMQEEVEGLHKTHTWDIMDLSPGKLAIGCKWVYKIKI